MLEKVQGEAEIIASVCTRGGISSTIDEALAITTLLFEKETAEKTQLIMQYNPDSPVHAGDPSQAGHGVMFNTTRKSLPYEPGFSDAGQVFLDYLENAGI